MNKPKLTMFETFSGIGAQRRGLENSNLFDFEVIGTSDIDKNAILGYAAIHHGLTGEMVENYENYPSREEMAQYLLERKVGYDFQKNKQYDWTKLAKAKDSKNKLRKNYLANILTKNYGDISSVEELPYADVLTFSFPCTDISLAGKQEGIKEGETRSGLVYEIVRLIKVAKEKGTLPKYLLLENVANLVGKKFIKDFENLNAIFNDLGYNVYWKLINAKETGIPQNRLRCFAWYIRKDIDTGKFTFPTPFDNGIRLKDILEKNVDEKYYINTERASNLIKQLAEKGQLKGQNEDFKSILVKNQATEYTKTIEIANTLMARDYKGFGNQDMVAIVESGTLDSPRRLGDLWDGETKHQAGSIWDTDGMSTTLDTAQGGMRQPCIVEAIEDGSCKPIYLGNTTPSGKSQCNAVYSTDGVSQTLCAGTHGYATGNILEKQEVSQSKTDIVNKVVYMKNIYRIRKLTPRETMKLMGFTFEDWDKCVAIGLSNSAGYKAAGNSIVTNCIQLLFEHLYKAQYDENYICTDEKMQNFQIL